MRHGGRSIDSWPARARGLAAILVLLCLLYGVNLLQMHHGLEEEEHASRMDKSLPFSSKVGTTHNDAPPLTRAQVTPLPPQPPLDGRFPPPNLTVIPLDPNTMAKPSVHYKPDPLDLWESDTAATNILPRWMKDYFAWHKEQRQQPHEQSSYLIVSCLASYRKCGGTADRLMTLPFFLKVAAVSKRVLLYQWERPAPLEAFFMPPMGGMDWRVPQGDENLFSETNGVHAGGQEEILRLAGQARHAIVWVRFQSHDHGATYYEMYKTPTISSSYDYDEPSFRSVFSQAWRTVFTPAPALATEIQAFLHNHPKLVPGQYPSVHLRALYGVADRSEQLLEGWARNAVHCGSQLVQRQESQYPVLYLASDSRYVTSTAVTYGKQRGWTVVTADAATTAAQTNKNPLHLDKAGPGHDVSEYYDTFLDLYIMALGHCVAYSMGNYGLFALYMSDDAACGLQHHAAATDIQPCALLAPPTTTSPEDHAAATKLAALFVPPMDPVV